MGVCKILSGGSTTGQLYDVRNPNPRVFIISETLEIGVFTIADIEYPNCENYEGHKILVFCGVSAQELRQLKTIDPHFIEDSLYSPIARFEPTPGGWNWAVKFCDGAI